VLAEFQPAEPERALPAAADRTLLDVMRDVVNRGTGSSIRSRFGIRADVAGKTGTTQDNADGWFILMQPQLVAGAWVGFDDGRVTLGSNYWGEGAHSALPIVGDFFQRALRARLIDSRARFNTEVEPGTYQVFRDKLHAWVAYLFGSHTQTQGQKQSHTQAASSVHHAAPKPVPAAPASVYTPPAASTPQTSAPRELPPLLGGAGPAGSSPMPASSGAAASTASSPIAPRLAPTIVPPGPAQGNGAFPPEAPGSTPTPTPDVPEATSATNAD
jgi:penicillin-binding protein 1A